MRSPGWTGAVARCAPPRKRGWVGRKQRGRGKKKQKNEVEKPSLEFPYFQGKPKAKLSSAIIVKIRVTLAEASAQGAAEDAQPQSTPNSAPLWHHHLLLWSGASAISSGGLLLSDSVQHFILSCPCRGKCRVCRGGSAGAGSCPRIAGLWMAARCFSVPELYLTRRYRPKTETQTHSSLP